MDLNHKSTQQSIKIHAFFLKKIELYPIRNIPKSLVLHFCRALEGPLLQSLF